MTKHTMMTVALVFLAACETKPAQNECPKRPDCPKQPEGWAMYFDIPGGGSSDRAPKATFYGKSGRESCEEYRKLFAGFCNWVDKPYPVCTGINEETLDNTYCKATGGKR